MSTHIHISRDLLRSRRQPESRQLELLREALASGRSVVVDNTNGTVASRAPLIALARQHGAAVKGFFFDTAPPDALRRNRLRTGRARVPAVAIFAIRKRLEPPSAEEGFDEIWTVRVDEPAKTFTISQAHP